MQVKDVGHAVADDGQRHSRHRVGRDRGQVIGMREPHVGERGPDIDSRLCAAEPTVEVTLYQAVPKLDKLEHIIQKSVELGVTRIVPVLTRRCVSRPKEKDFEKKLEIQGYKAFEDSLTGEEIIDLLNKNEQLKNMINCTADVLQKHYNYAYDQACRNIDNVLLYNTYLDKFS